MPVTREQLREQIRRREIWPVYLLYGTETYLRDAAARTIADLCFGEGDLRDFNDVEFSLNTPDNIDAALAAADQLPMMASRRVIRVTDVRVAASAGRDSLKEAYLEKLKAYLLHPSPSSVLIFIADEVNGNRRVGKLLREAATAVEFKPVEEAEIFVWARRRLKELGSEMDEHSLRHLIALVGPDIRRLLTEIDKLSAAALPDKLINADLIDLLVADVRELSDNFGLAKHLLAGEREVGLRLLKKMLDDGAEPVGLVGLLSYNYRRLLMVKDLMARDTDRSEIARAMNLRSREHEEFIAAARRADLESLKRAVVRLAETDLAIKTSVAGPAPKGARMQLEILVCELASA